MTVAELSNSFDILYDNISSGSAPGLDQYEKSFYLTTAQNEIVRSIYGPYNKQGKGFEGNEQRRRELSALVKTHKTNVFDVRTEGLFPTSKFVSLPENLMYIVYESVEVMNKNGDINRVEVVPIEYDKLTLAMKNPFRKPNDKRVFRLDVSKSATLKNVELVPSSSISNYNLRYIKYPSPIVLTDFELDPNLTGLGLKINGINTVTNCELDEAVQVDILNRAVELAIRDYRENTLQSKIQTNNRLV